MQEKIKARQIDIDDLAYKILPKEHTHSMSDLQFDPDQYTITAGERALWNTVSNKAERNHTHSADDIVDGTNNKVFTAEEKTLLSNLNQRFNDLNESSFTYYTSDIQVKNNETEKLFVTADDKAKWNGYEERKANAIHTHDIEDITLPEDSFFISSSEKQLIATLQPLSGGGYYYRRTVDPVPAIDIEETNSKQFVTAADKTKWNGYESTLSNLSTSDHTHSADQITATTLRQFVTAEEKQLIASIPSKANINHYHTSNEITPFEYRTFISETDRASISNHKHSFEEIIYPSWIKYFTTFDKYKLELASKHLYASQFVLNIEQEGQTEFSITISDNTLLSCTPSMSFISNNGLILNEGKHYTLTQNINNSKNFTLTITDNTIVLDNSDYPVLYLWYNASIDWTNTAYSDYYINDSFSNTNNEELYLYRFDKYNSNNVIEIHDYQIYNFNSTEEIDNLNTYTSFEFNKIVVPINGIDTLFDGIGFNTVLIDENNSIYKVNINALDIVDESNNYIFFSIYTKNTSSISLFAKWQFIYNNIEKYEFENGAAKLSFYIKYRNLNNDVVTELITSCIVSINNAEELAQITNVLES